MKKYLLTLSIGLIYTISWSQNLQTGKTKLTSSNRTSKFDTLYTNLYNKGAFNGSVLIAEKGNIIFEKSYGLANEQTKEKLNNNSIFELASVSKQFTAMGIVQLEKKGKLSYEDDITKYVPELKFYTGITIRNLLNHTGGLPNYLDLAKINWDKTNIATNDDIIIMFERIKPNKLFEPNEKWDYNNTGYLVLATIIERVSGQEFGKYLNDKIFKPLNMENTFVYRRRFSPKKIENYANGYIYSDSLKMKIIPEKLNKYSFVTYLDGVVGDGSINSNLRDLLKWDRALYKNNLISEKDRELMFSSAITKDSTETNYGFGWMIDSKKTYGKIVSHSGGWDGYVT